MLMTPETSKKHMECGSIYMTNKYGKVWGRRTLALVFKAATTAAENSRTQNTPSGQHEWESYVCGTRDNKGFKGQIIVLSKRFKEF